MNLGIGCIGTGWILTVPMRHLDGATETTSRAELQKTRTDVGRRVIVQWTLLAPTLILTVIKVHRIAAVAVAVLALP